MAPEHLTPAEAATRLRPKDTLAIPLGPGQPPAFLAALGERDDWQGLRIGGALLLAWSEAYKHPNVHVLSGFWGHPDNAEGPRAFAEKRPPQWAPPTRTFGG